MAQRLFKLEGDLELYRKLSKLRGTVQGAQAQAVLVSAARLISDAAEREAPRGRTGELAKSLRSGAGRKENLFLSAYSFTVFKLAYYAHMVELGTKSHSLKTGSGKAAKSRPDGSAKKLIQHSGDVFSRGGAHPGGKASHFFRKAIQRSKKGAADIIETGFRRVIEAAAR